MRRALAVIAALIGGVLGYGFWHQRTHATLSISVRDASQPRAYRTLPQVRLRLLDAHGRELAQAGSGDDGIVALTAPQEFSCRAIERRASASAEARAAWQRCFDAQSRFIAVWIERLDATDVAVGRCRLRAKLRVDRSGDDWWLWWVPLPHVGGTPYRHYSVNLTVDEADCVVVAER
jgi:hypothetical protein